MKVLTSALCFEPLTDSARGEIPRSKARGMLAAMADFFVKRSS
jgi:hypothetical protein